MKYKVLFFGPQGSGKGTQAARLASRLNLPALSLGELLRQEIAKGTELGQKIDAIIRPGNLVSAEMARDVVRARLQESDANVGYILDGYPRTMEQLEFFAEFDQPTHVIVLELPREEAVKRLTGRRVCQSCGKVFHVAYDPPPASGLCDHCGSQIIQRDDDTEEAIQRRLDLYYEKTEPVLQAYERQGLLHHINGRGTMDEVEERIRRALGL